MHQKRSSLNSSSANPNSNHPADSSLIKSPKSIKRDEEDDGSEGSAASAIMTEKDLLGSPNPMNNPANRPRQTSTPSMNSNLELIPSPIQSSFFSSPSDSSNHPNGGNNPSNPHPFFNHSHQHHHHLPHPSLPHPSTLAHWTPRNPPSMPGGMVLGGRFPSGSGSQVGFEFGGRRGEGEGTGREGRGNGGVVGF